MRVRPLRATPMLTFLAASLVSIGVSSVFAPRDVEACGGFFSSSSVYAGRKPSLAYEQVLIVHDPRTEKEHFVREVAFRGGRQPFGFVVPTPSRPEVAKVDKSPFEGLRSSFPFVDESLGRAFELSMGHGAGQGAGSGGGVTVLDIAKVGSFTAFVLTADDETALARWLKSNGLVSTPEADAWLAHYVRMKFFYVAMRYDPPKQEGGAKAEVPLKAETIRISFSTPVPYYPYFEPKAPALPDAGEGTPPRLLELWVVSPALLTPIAARKVGGDISWVRPMLEGFRWKTDVVDKTRLTRSLGPELGSLVRSAGPWVVQTFQDQKYSREGYGDVLFAPDARGRLDAPAADKLRPLLGILDPALVPEKGAAP